MTDNSRQKAFYESRFEAHGADEEAANWITNRWRDLRRRLIAVDTRIGVGDAILDQHKLWLGDLSGKRVLDLGCFSGNALSLYLARNAGAYVGIDLSEKAVGVLRQSLAGIPSATAVAGDFLHQDLGKFDVVYAHSVLHHFRDFDGLCRRLCDVLSEGGIVVSLDPLQTDPLNRLARILYRPFQSDRDWEWPFTRTNFRTLKRYFTIEATQGDRGLSKVALLIPPLAGWGKRMDDTHANRLSPYLYLCWRVSMKLRKL